MKYYLLVTGEPIADSTGQVVSGLKEITKDEYDSHLKEWFDPSEITEVPFEKGAEPLFTLNTPKNQAWAALRDNADLDGSWPELKAALNKAVDWLGEDATAAEIYDKSIELLE